MATRRQLQTLPHLCADAARLVTDLERETDRGVALLAVAFLDDVLDLLLRASFVDDAEAVNRLIGPGRPLESFGSRAHICYCMGLLGQDVYNDINLIREIRNDFAHRQPTNFEQADIRLKCTRLRCVAPMLHENESCTTRECFIASVVVIANHLIVQASEQAHYIPAKSFSENGVLRLR
ncbi:MAG TPA: MltR family transcriptional regulator [Tepidisphaeraceae bacterium]|jgi:DNA-binding MltR family transcriptional regulator|nr:MltR family transcriptional regulator [Tepidisphaeraceae bacterium]